jgi:hypothetical protein
MHRKLSSRRMQMDENGETLGHTMLAEEAPPNMSNQTSSADILEGAGRLESLAAARLPARAEHRLAASSVVLALITLIGAALFILVLRRPVLRRPAARGEEWTRINAEAQAAPPPTHQGRTVALQPNHRYNTFSTDDVEDEEAWLAAKQEWHAAIDAAKQSRRSDSSSCNPTSAAEAAEQL